MEAVLEKSVGMGAIAAEEGVTFRVWAPHADRVFVKGDFNDWSDNEDELEHEEKGYWATVVEKAKTGDEYKFVIHNGDQVLEKNDPYAREVTNSAGNSIVHQLDFEWEDEGFMIPDWNTLVIYEMHIGTFSGFKDGQPGTFEDAIKKIPYLKSLGINAVEVMPVAEFPGGISWGYNPAYPFAIESDYGGPQGFAYFVNEMHKNGIAVIMDVVYNHFGPTDIDLWRFDGWYENDKGGIYFYNDNRAETPWGATRPDYGRPEVRQYIIDNAKMWLEQYHCDGLRMDATSFIRYEDGGMEYMAEINEGNILMRDINAELQRLYPKNLSIAEDLKGHSIVTDPIDQGGLGYGTQWDMNFVHPIKKVLTELDDVHRDMQTIVDAVLYQYSGNPFARTIYTESHDEVANGKARVPEEIEPGQADSEFAKKRALLGIVLTMTAPGIPLVFQGQEFVEDEYFQDTEALDWNKFKQHKGITRFFSDIVNLRSRHDTVTPGLQGRHTHIVHFNQETKVVSYLRSMNEDFSDATMIVLNFSNVDFESYSVGVPELGTWNLHCNSTWEGYDTDFSEMDVIAFNSEEQGYDNQPYKGTFNLPKYTGLIFSTR